MEKTTESKFSPLPVFRETYPDSPIQNHVVSLHKRSIAVQ